jgi:hypothetical protein
MLVRQSPAAWVVVCAAVLLAQDGYDRDAYARDHVKFLVLQLDQWSTEFPQQFYKALMQPPVDASKVPESAKTGAGELGESLKKLAALSSAKDLMTNQEFRGQLEKTLTSAKDLNQAIAAQRFPMVLQSDWDQIRSTLNNLARIYKVETLAVLEAPGGGGGRGGRGGRGAAAGAAPATGVVPGGLAGYIVDQRCAARGKGMWTNAQCVATCVRDGDKVVLVTEEGKVYQIANQDKITQETYGQVVTLLGKTDGDTITVESIKM